MTSQTLRATREDTVAEKMGRCKLFFRNIFTCFTKRTRENDRRKKFMFLSGMDSIDTGSYHDSIYHGTDRYFRDLGNISPAENMFSSGNMFSSKSEAKMGGITRTLTSEELIVHRADELGDQILIYGANNDVINHIAGIENCMDYLWKTKELCDVKIYVDNVVYHAHRFVLTWLSPKLSDFFSKLKWKGDGPIPVKVSNYSSEAFHVFLQFAYKGILDVDSELIAEVIEMADEMNIPALKERCLNFLDNVSLEAVVEVLLSKQLSPNSEQFRSAVHRLSKEFPQVYSFKRFFELDVSIVCQILSSDDLEVSTEMDVFRVAVKWINHHLDNRRQYLPRVLKLVRFPYMSQKELFECFKTTDLLEECSEIIELIKKANWVITARQLHQDDPLNTGISTARKCYTQKLSSKC